MARTVGDRAAFGAPGLQPRWATGRKDGVGTAYSADSRLWFTLAEGIVTEVFFPAIDAPQLQNLRFLVTDGKTFLHDEQKDLLTACERLSPHALGYRMRNRDPAGRYAIVKTVISDPHLPTLLQHVTLEGTAEDCAGLQLYVLAAPHLGVGGLGNNAYVVEAAGREVLVAEGKGTWLALAANVPFLKTSCGYAGHSDGWADLAQTFQLGTDFDVAQDGNVGLIGELSLAADREFVLALAFGQSLNNALSTLLQSLGVPFAEHERRFVVQWDRVGRSRLPLDASSGDNGHLYHTSYSLLLGHEDKTFPGAIIASLAIPWGEAKSDEERGGYHLVWTRDLVNSASGLLAAGNLDTPFRALVYLMAIQAPDGGFPQNFWIDGEAYWRGIQLDQVAFPILLARQLLDAGGLREVDPYPLIKSAAAFLIRNGPVTQQERWEENSGYSPSTLAACIAALICAARFARERADESAAVFMEEYADFLECHLEDWTVTRTGTLHPEVARHFIRILPVEIGDVDPVEDPDALSFRIANLQPEEQAEFPAKEIVDAGFLELVRYGVRAADDSLIVDSLKVVDSVIKVDTPFGPCWRRYNHDGYGQGPGGEPFVHAGRGRAWPLLTGERGHYELARGGDVRLYLHAMEQFASECGLLPEQVWDEAEVPGRDLTLGGPTGSATPLMWAHAEYIKLLRSLRDGKIFDLIPEVHQRYVSARDRLRPREIWKWNRHVRAVRRGWAFRVQAPEPFRLRWSLDNWQTTVDTNTTATSLGIHYVDLDVPREQQEPIRFTLYWLESSRWEDKHYEVAITE